MSKLFIKSHPDAGIASLSSTAHTDLEWGLLQENDFHNALHREKKRMERSGKAFLLLLISMEHLPKGPSRDCVLKFVSSALFSVTREPDIKGWYRHYDTLGVILTDLDREMIQNARERIVFKIRDHLSNYLDPEQLDSIGMSFDCFPESIRTEQTVQYPKHPYSFHIDSPVHSPSHLVPSLVASVFGQKWPMAAGDIFLVALVYAIGTHFAPGSFLAVSNPFHVVFWIFILLSYPAAFHIFDLYSMERTPCIHQMALRTALATSLVSVLSLLVVHVDSLQEHSGTLFTVQTILIWVSVTVWRIAHRNLSRFGHSKTGALVLGAGESGKAVYHILKNPFSPYEVKGFLDDDPAKQGKIMGSPAVVGTLDRLSEIASRIGARAAVLATSRDLSVRHTQKIVEARLGGIEIVDSSALYEKLTGRIPVEHIEDRWFLSSDGFRILCRPYVQYSKRIMDLIFASILFVVALPVMVITAVAIRMESPGPVFYRQDRVGRGCMIFKVVKFRSMRLNAEEEGARWAQKNDSRVTRVGRWIRAFRIDELPQLWNVFKGDMSLVGPRPERPEFVEELVLKIPYYNARHAVAPGITGWAQIKYPYGASLEDALHKLEYDLYYIKNVSILLDLKILLRTIGVVLMGEGAR